MDCPSVPPAVVIPSHVIRRSSGAIRPTSAFISPSPAAAHPDPDQEPGADQEIGLGRRLGGEQESGHPDERAGRDHADRSPAVGDHRGERRGEADDEVLGGDRERDGFATP